MITFKEEMLMNLLDCGSADLSLLEDINYDFVDVRDEVESFTTIQDMKFNDILVGAIYIFMNNINEIIENKVKEKEEEIKYLEDRLDYVAYGKRDLMEIEIAKEDLEKLNELYVYDDIEYYCNYLDNSIYIVDEDKKAIYKEFLSKEIDEENEKLGFCCLDLN